MLVFRIFIFCSCPKCNEVVSLMGNQFSWVLFFFLLFFFLLPRIKLENIFINLGSKNVSFYK